ncbi:MAG: glycosyltransferase family 25 protein [Allgaiera sp.]|jgi:GR25 family glycosyltransferase involved in LPS biosynthesis|nr:glycosyltransferase family 25 protein [Allgaiera sp.]
MKVPVFYINLDRVSQRAKFMETQCAHAGFDGVCRFSAVDAASMPPSPHYQPGRWGAYWSLLPSEVAVFESHRRIWTKVAGLTVPAVILEDDVLLSRLADRRCSDLADFAERFDLIKLDALAGSLRLGPETRIGKVAVRPLTGVVPSAAAYLLSPIGAKLLLKLSERYCDHLDDFVTRVRRDYRAFQLTPAVAVQGMFADVSCVPDIPADAAGSERTASETGAASRAARGPALYRLRKEAVRGGRKLVRLLWRDRALVTRGGVIGEVPLAEDLPPYR